MTKVSAGVYRAKSVSAEDIKFLRAACLNTRKKRARICLHDSDESPIQEMFVAMANGTKVPVHSHAEYETITIVQGACDVTIWDKGGEFPETIRLGKSYLSCRIPMDRWHQVEVVGDIVVIHEVKHGPFKPMVTS